MRQPRTSKKSVKTARLESAAKRTLKQKEEAGYRVIDGIEFPPGAILANWDALQHNAATIPHIAYPRFYADRSFQCRDCSAQEIWTAGQQKWWYETAKGRIDSTAVRCRACRRRERERIAAHRTTHLAGLAHKAEKKA